MNRTWRVIGAALLVAIVQIGFLAALIEGRASILRDGREVLLKVEPVDPRDLLRGDYVRLGYEITTLDWATIATGREPLRRGTAIMVRLAPGEDGLWRAVGARLADQPAVLADDDTVEIAGLVDSDLGGSEMLRATYGIERFYLPEGEGRPIERDLSVRPFRMLVAIGHDGKAQIKAFFDGSERLFDEALY
ncbi:hypothetical protein EJC49_16540 [Aquibium carbonis]|uniref:Membrane-anchored protein n=1 Tax=Aquibium carbonis TaxID=2495581 RepID=A0A3R9Y6K0_9HYPH|nr:GDYXXLXY domain-containing protein [Aquibium carbonis]RST85278.1 hypothetical protein EJC49_16540 [Aquibium carbonis]